MAIFRILKRQHLSENSEMKGMVQASKQKLWDPLPRWWFSCKQAKIWARGSILKPECTPRSSPSHRRASASRIHPLEAKVVPERPLWSTPRICFDEFCWRVPTGSSTSRTQRDPAHSFIRMIDTTEYNYSCYRDPARMNVYVHIPTHNFPTMHAYAILIFTYNHSFLHSFIQIYTCSIYACCRDPMGPNITQLFMLPRSCSTHWDTVHSFAHSFIHSPDHMHFPSVHAAATRRTLRNTIMHARYRELQEWKYT